MPARASPELSRGPILESSFGPASDAAGSRELRLGAAVIAGLAADTELLAPLRERFAAWQDALVADGIAPASASLIRLAADGLWFTELLSFAPLDEGLRSAVRDELLGLLGSSLEAASGTGGLERAESAARCEARTARERRLASFRRCPRTHSARRVVVAGSSVSTFVEWAGAGSVIPLLPLYLRKLGAPVALVGAVMAAFFLAAILVQYPVGRLSDRIGRRPVQLGGLVTFAAASIAFALIGTPIAALFMRGLQGAGSGVVDVANNATVGEVVAPSQQGRADGTLFGSRTVGLAIGPFAGGLVGTSEMRWLFVAAALASLLACVPVLVAVPKTGSRSDRT